MIRRTILCALAGAAMIPAGAAFAQHGHAGGTGHSGATVGAMGGANVNVGGPGHGVGAGASMSTRVSPRGGSTINATTGTHARVNSQSGVHASTRALAHANVNSVFRGSRVISGPLTGLTVGTAVRNSAGVQIGTIRKVLTASGGRVVNVLVRSNSSPRTIPMAPTSLNFSGGVVTASHLRGRL